MSRDNPNIRPPQELLSDSQEWTESQFLAEAKTRAEEALEKLYLHGVTIYETHRQKLLERIEREGGIAHYTSAGSLLRGNLNGLICESGEFIGARDFLCMEPIEWEVDDEDSAGFADQQLYQVRLSFGGNGIGVEGYDATEVNDLTFAFGDDVFREIIEGTYRPCTVCVTEAVVSEYGSRKSASGVQFQVAGRVWGAKLRPEYAPDPHKEPEAYAAWVRQKPIPQLDIGFAASPGPLRKDYYYGPVNFGSVYRMKQYVSQTEYIPLEVEGAKKMLRFEQLFKVIWENEFGSTLPDASVPIVGLPIEDAAGNQELLAEN